MGLNTDLTKLPSPPEFLKDPLLMLLWAEQLESTEDTESDLMKRPPGWKKFRLGCSAVVELTPGNQAVLG